MRSAFQQTRHCRPSKLAHETKNVIVTLFRSVSQMTAPFDDTVVKELGPTLVTVVATQRLLHFLVLAQT